jgi:hypothetical protein
MPPFAPTIILLIARPGAPHQFNGCALRYTHSGAVHQAMTLGEKLGKIMLIRGTKVQESPRGID